MHKIILLLLLISNACNQINSEKKELQRTSLSLKITQAHDLSLLPLNCLKKQYPNKLNQTLSDSTQIKPPKQLHPAFYGCFDWHSSVHGHWSLVYLLKKFPELENA